MTRIEEAALFGHLVASILSSTVLTCTLMVNSSLLFCFNVKGSLLSFFLVCRKHPSSGRINSFHFFRLFFFSSRRCELLAMMGTMRDIPRLCYSRKTMRVPQNAIGTRAKKEERPMIVPASFQRISIVYWWQEPSKRDALLRFTTWREGVPSSSC